MHTFMVNGTQFIVDNIYHPIKPVGTGAYGIVWCVRWGARVRGWLARRRRYA
jgi:hypothetical protein